MKLRTIKSSEEISSIFKSGKRVSNGFLTLMISADDSARKSDRASEHGLQGRVAFIAGKKNGNACWRNAAKRRMREIVRALDGPWDGYDVLFIAKKPITKASYSKVLTTVENTVNDSVLGKVRG